MNSAELQKQIQAELDPTLNMFDKTSVPVWEQGQLGGRVRPINQDVLFKNLCDITEVFDKYKIKYAISHGTLLGLVRLGQLIPWDDDIDFTMFVEDMPKMAQAEAELRELGFYIPVRTENPQDRVNKLEKMFWYDANFLRDGEKCEGWFVERGSDKWIYDPSRSGLAWPHKFLDTLGTVEWRGRLFSCPNNKEEYLTLMYGNVPIDYANRKRKYKELR